MVEISDLKRTGPGRCRRALGLAVSAVALFALACTAEAPEDPGPPGAWWVGDADSVRAVLEPIGTIEGTPAARAARQLAAVLPDCPRLGARIEEGDLAQLLFETRCIADGDPLADAQESAGIAFALPIEAGRRVRGALRVDAGALIADVHWPKGPTAGALHLLVPGATPAGPDLLHGDGRLLHARVRPEGGVDVGALVPPGSQADELFALRSALFADAVLDGTWEAAVYLPERPGALPGAALALGFRSRSAAVAGAETFIDSLRDTWHVHRSDFRLAGAEGACLPALNLLPDFAPCYVATDEAIVVGWNVSSLRRALPESPTGGAEDESASREAARVDLDLALIEHTDARIAAALRTAELPTRWPWRRLHAEGHAEAERIRWQVKLLPDREALARASGVGSERIHWQGKPLPAREALASGAVR